MWATRLRELNYPEWFRLRIYQRYGHDIATCDRIADILEADDRRAGIGWFSAKVDSEAVLIHDAATALRREGLPVLSILETAGRFAFSGALEGRSLPWIVAGSIGGIILEATRELMP